MSQPQPLVPDSQAGAPQTPDLPPLKPVPPGLYRHYKGGWYEVLDAVRCSETLQGLTLYRALYGGWALWVRPSAMFAEVGLFDCRQQARFARWELRDLVLGDLPAAQALVAHLRGLARRRGFDLDSALRAPPPEPESCCGRGCNGCLWESYFTALRYWRDDACDRLESLQPEPATASPG
jgi:hypothetical protein